MPEIGTALFVGGVSLEMVVTPSGMTLDGSLDTIEAPPATSENDDPDLDGVANEIPTSLVDHLEFYLLNYFKPATYQQTNRTRRGRRLFKKIQCTECHTPDLVIERDIGCIECGHGTRSVRSRSGQSGYR